MKPNNGQTPDLDRVVADIRDEAIDPTAFEQSAERLEAAIAREESVVDQGAETINSCDDFQSLIPAYLTHSLAAARTLLLEDHTRSCVPCRKALKVARAGGAKRASAAPQRERAWPRAIAAALVIGVTAGSLYLFNEMRTVSGTFATIETMDGKLFQHADTGTASPVTIQVGHQLASDDVFHTAKDSGAMVRLADGTLVEVSERSELSFAKRKGGITIDLARGNIIVHAAKQRDGHLFVKTDDCLVSVTGTVFSVNRGTKGSRVSVIEGRVEVDDAHGEHVLGAGDQVTTHPSLGQVPVEDEIAWSKNLDEHLALLEEFAALGRELDESVTHPDPRLSSPLLSSLPADTVVYAAVPNLGNSVGQAYDVVRQRIQESEILRSWWNDSVTDDIDATREMQRAVDQIRELGEYLGEEIIVTVQIDENGKPGGHLLLAETADAPALVAFIEDEVLSLGDKHGGELPIKMIDDPRDEVAAIDGSHQLYIWVDNSIVAVSLSLGTLVELADNIDAGGSEFTSSPFHERIQATYTSGVSWVFAADLQLIWDERYRDGMPESRFDEYEAFEALGLLDLEHVVFDQRDDGDQTHRRALISFDQPRRGVASWLAAPAPMATLEFLSPDASVAAAFVVRDPVAMLDELFTVFADRDGDFMDNFAAFEEKAGLSIREDIAAPLGGEFVFAIDGPLLPTPSWKVVVEVYDPAGLEQTIDFIIGKANEHLADMGETEIAHTSETFSGRTFHVVSMPGPTPDIHFTIVDGYLVMGPSRALLERAIQFRDSSYNLSRSPKLQALFPKDGYANFSALIYQNIAPLIGPVAEKLLDSKLELSEDQKDVINRITADAKPSLYYGYAEEDQVIFAGSGRSGFFGMDLQTLLSLRGLLQLGETFDHLATEGIRQGVITTP